MSKKMFVLYLHNIQLLLFNIRSRNFTLFYIYGKADDFMITAAIYNKLKQ